MLDNAMILTSPYFGQIQRQQWMCH